MTVNLFLSQLPGGDAVQSDPRPEGLPLLRRARLQGHVLPHPPPRPAVHLAVQHARGEQLAGGRRRLGDQPFRPHAPHVHVLPGLGRLQLHLQRDADGQRRDGERCSDRSVAFCDAVIFKCTCMCRIVLSQENGIKTSNKNIRLTSDKTNGDKSKDERRHYTGVLSR